MSQVAFYVCNVYWLHQAFTITFLLFLIFSIQFITGYLQNWVLKSYS